MLALLAALAAAPPTAAAASESVDEIERWVPAFSLFFDAVGQKGRGSVTSGEVLGPPLTEGGCLLTENRGQPPEPQPGDRTNDLCPVAPGLALIPENIAPRKIQPDDVGADTNVAPLVGASLELMTPRLFAPLLQPRLFVHGEAAVAFGFERNLAGARAPDDFSPPAENLKDDVQEEGVVGQGTRTKIQIQPLVLSAGAGVAFSIRPFERRIRIKPSFEYQRQQLDLIGTVRRAVKLVEESTPPNTAFKPTEFRFISLDFTDEATLHGYGPGLELEVDTLSVDPFLMSIFLMGRGYYHPGKLDYSFTEINEFGETASWTIELDPWSWRSGVGVRFRWVPE